MVKIWPEDSKRPNRINVCFANACATALCVKPEITWRRGMLCKTGVTATFNEGFETTPAERILTVPYISGVPKHLKDVKIVFEQGWNPLRPYQEAAANAWPAMLDDDSIPAYTKHSMDRARISGLSVDALWVFNKFLGFVQPSRVAAPMHYVKAINESGPGYGDWMGSPWGLCPTGDLATSK